MKKRSSKSYALSVQVKHLCKALAQAKASDTVVMSVEDDDHVLLRVKKGGGTHERSSKHKISQVMVEKDHLDPPYCDYPNAALFVPPILSEVCKELKGVGETLNISCMKECIEFSTSGDIQSTVRVAPMEGSEDVVVQCESETDVTCSFKFFSILCGAAKLKVVEKVMMQSGKDLPVCLTLYFFNICLFFDLPFAFHSKQKSKLADFGKLEFFLAPFVAEN